MTEAVKSMLFNVYGSEIYDDMVWLGQHQPGVTSPVYRGLEYIAQAIQQLQPTVPDAAALVHQYTAQSLGGLRRSLTASPAIVARFFVNAVEFQARVQYAVSTLAPMSPQDAGSIKEWLRNEDATHRMATSSASFFTSPLAWSLANDADWMRIDDSAKTRLLLWGTLSTANLFAGHLLNSFKQQFDLARVETQEAVFAHLRAAWMGYVTQLLDAENSLTERAVLTYLVALTGDQRMLEVYGMHMMNAFRNQLYKVDPQAENYDHFALILRPYAPQVQTLDEQRATEFFENSRLLAFVAAETQWMQKIVQADVTESDAISVNQNLSQKVMAMMRDPRRQEFKGFYG